MSESLVQVLNFRDRRGEMASADNQGCVSLAIAGLLALTVALSEALAESKFLSLHVGYAGKVLRVYLGA